MPNPTHHICPECFYTWAHGQDGGHSCVQQLRRYRLPADVRLPGGMTIARGCELNTVLLALRHREAGEAWQTSFDVPIPVDGQLQQLIRALPVQPPRETGPAYMAGAPLLSAAAQDVLAERNRQIIAEGYDASHDDMATNGQIAVAAGYYALICGYPHERDIGPHPRRPTASVLALAGRVLEAQRPAPQLGQGRRTDPGRDRAAGPSQRSAAGVASGHRQRGRQP